MLLSRIILTFHTKKKEARVPLKDSRPVKTHLLKITLSSLDACIWFVRKQSKIQIMLSFSCLRVHSVKSNKPNICLCCSLLYLFVKV